MTTPTLSMQLAGEAGRAEARHRMRSEAAKKAWRTRRRLAKPTKVMRQWLEWLAQCPENAVVQRFDSWLGSMFTFGAFPEDSQTTCTVSLGQPEFTRGTFRALERRGWVEQFHRTPDASIGFSYVNDRRVDRYGHCCYWRITDKGRRALGGHRDG